MSAIEQALEMHEKWNGKIETTAKSHVNSREDLAIAYTPGVAEPCKVKGPGCSLQIHDESQHNRCSIRR